MTNDYAMFTAAGDEAVHAVVQRVVNSGLFNNEAWSLAYNELDILSQREGFTEAMDTDVRDHVYFALQDLDIIDDFETDFYI